jgi:hypothetical protein
MASRNSSEYPIGESGSTTDGSSGSLGDEMPGELESQEGTSEGGVGGTGDGIGVDEGRESRATVTVETESVGAGR